MWPSPSKTIWTNLVRAADSTSNNLIEADDASSHADFTAKMGIALREAKESRYQLQARLRRMKVAIWIVVSLIAFVGLLALIGVFLPVSHEASRFVEFNKPPEAVWALVADPDSYRAWWQGADVKTAVVESVPPARLVTKIVGETQFGGTWTLEITPTPTGSRLTVTERGEIYNVVFRTLARYVFGYAGTVESFLEAARRKLST